MTESEGLKITGGVAKQSLEQRVSLIILNVALSSDPGCFQNIGNHLFLAYSHDVDSIT